MRYQLGVDLVNVCSRAFAKGHTRQLMSFCCYLCEAPHHVPIGAVGRPILMHHHWRDGRPFRRT